MFPGETYPGDTCHVGGRVLSAKVRQRHDATYIHQGGGGGVNFVVHVAQLSHFWEGFDLIVVVW